MKKMVLGKTLSLAGKIVVFLVTFLIAAWVLIEMKIWSADLNTYFIRTGRWGELLFVILLVLIVTSILERLLRWEFRLQLRSEKRKGRK